MPEKKPRKKRVETRRRLTHVRRTQNTDRMKRLARVREMVITQPHLTQDEIATILGVCRVTIGNDIQKVFVDWIDEDTLTTKKRVLFYVRRYDRAASEAFNAWKRSQKNAEQVTTAFVPKRCPLCKGKGKGKEGGIRTGGDEGPHRGTNWESQRTKARARDKNTCQRCGATQESIGKTLDVHHIVPWRDFDGDWKRANRLDNLITYCPSCHQIIEWEAISKSATECELCKGTGTVLEEQVTRRETGQAGDPSLLREYRENTKEAARLRGLYARLRRGRKSPPSPEQHNHLHMEVDWSRVPAETLLQLRGAMHDAVEAARVETLDVRSNDKEN